MGRIWLKKQMELCGEVLKMEHVMSTVTQTVNFQRFKALNRNRFGVALSYRCAVTKFEERFLSWVRKSVKTSQFFGTKSGNVSWRFGLT